MGLLFLCWEISGVSAGTSEWAQTHKGWCSRNSWTDRHCCLQYFFMCYICECQRVLSVYHCWLLWHMQVCSWLHTGTDTGENCKPWWENSLCVIKSTLCNIVRFYCILSHPASRSVGWWCIEATMETTGSATEGDPLKRGEDGAETGTVPTATELKKKSCKEVLGFAKLTHWRTAVFFLSLFLCLTIVFAFSFIIPCPVRPQYLTSWNRTFTDAGVKDCGPLTAWWCFKSRTNHYAFFIYHSNLWLLGYWRYKRGQGDGCPVCLQRHRRQQEQYVCWCRYKVFSSFNQYVLRKRELDSSVFYVCSFVSQVRTVLFFFFQVCPRHVCLCQQWMGLMERRCGSVDWIPSTTGPSVVWTKEKAESGTVCCPILTSSQPLTNTLVSDTLLCLCIVCDTNDTNFVNLNFYATFTNHFYTIKNKK